MSAAVAVKLALVCPATTVAVAGSVTLALLLVRDTANPPVGAAEVKDTLQDVLPGVLSDVIVQLSPPKEVVALGSEITPDVPAAERGAPSAVEAIKLLS